MTWEIWLPLVLLSIVKIVMTCLPNSTAGWLISKFEIHSKLSEENVIVTIDGKRLEDEDKTQVIDHFNQAIFLERYIIFPGYEQMYLHPENSGTSLVIDIKRGKRDVKLFVYIYNDHVDVVKQYKKKVVAYKLLSESLQNMFYVSNRHLV